MPAADTLLIEIDGPKVSRATADAGIALRLANAYVRLLGRLSSEEDFTATFRDLQVRDKCIAFAMKVSHPARLKRLTSRIAHMLQGVDPPSTGVASFVNELSSAIQALPEKQTAKIIIGPWEQPLSVADSPLSTHASFTTTLRARLIRIGGQRATAHFESDSEDEPFTVSLSEAKARKLAPHLYSELDIEVLLHRSADGAIDGGVLKEFYPMDEGDAMQLWQAFHSDRASEWDSVEDVEELLRSDRKNKQQLALLPGTKTNVR